MREQHQRLLDHLVEELRHDEQVLAIIVGGSIAKGREKPDYNRILYPYKKWRMTEVAQAPEKPQDFLLLAQCLLEERTCEASDALWQSLNAFRDWGVPWETAVARFMLDMEWGWRSGRLGLAES